MEVTLGDFVQRLNYTGNQAVIQQRSHPLKF